VHIPKELADRVIAYCEDRGLERFAIAARRLIRIGLETEEKRK